jgi:HEAT repeat protein
MAFAVLRMELDEIRDFIQNALAQGTPSTEFDEELERRARDARETLTPRSAESTARRLFRGTPAERKFSAILLREAPIGETMISEIVGSALDEEDDPAVIAEMVTTLGFTHDPILLDRLLQLVSHESDLVRFQLATALPQVGGWREDVVEALVRLATDVDSDVRWSAAFELSRCWNDEGGDDLLAILVGVAKTDPNHDVRAIVRLTLLQGD